jgi:hypothetical protein
MTPWVSTRTRTTTRAGRGNVLDESMHEEGVAVHVLADGVERALGDDIRVADTVHLRLQKRKTEKARAYSCARATEK